jgi:predicted NACHT family NTPase
VFDAAQHTLLVLGEPGAGKTTTLLELARDLIARARRGAHELAPVVLALSTWTGGQRDLSDWIVTELGLRYQVPKKVARTWLEDARLVLLLDGLDEVSEGSRTACVEAINAFSEKHQPPGLAVTCRVVEYEALAVKLRLRAAICLQPLTTEQVERYFAAAGAGLDPLRQAMRNDAGLRELARTPLMLSVMTMAWREAPTPEARGSGAKSIEEHRRQLFDAYVQAALNRRGKIAGKYSATDTVRWLAWLANRMTEHGQTCLPWSNCSLRGSEARDDS